MKRSVDKCRKSTFQNLCAKVIRWALCYLCDARIYLNNIGVYIYINDPALRIDSEYGHRTKMHLVQRRDNHPVYKSIETLVAIQPFPCICGHILFCSVVTSHAKEYYECHKPTD